MRLALLSSFALIVSGTAALAASPNEIGEAMTPAAVKTPEIPAAPAGGDTCNCIDLVLIVDTTGSMGSAIDNVKAGIAAIIDHAEATCTSVQAGLATFKDDVTVDHDLNFDVAGVEAAVGVLSAIGGADEPEASDEALRECVSEPGTVCVVAGDFTTANWRAECCKIAVLITDARPGGCDDIFASGVDDSNAHSRALEASGLGVKIGAIFVPVFGDPTGEITPVMTDYAATTGGVFGTANADGSGTADAIITLINTCAGGGGTELCCLPDGRCVEVLEGDCEAAGGRVVLDCAECPGPTPVAPSTWGSIKAVYR